MGDCPKHSSSSCSSAKTMNASHSVGLDLMKEGIRGLRESKGSTLKQIGKFLESKYGGSLSADKLRLYALLRKAATQGTEGKDIMVSGDGQHFKLAPTPKDGQSKAKTAGRRRHGAKSGDSKARTRSRKGKTAKRDRKTKKTKTAKKAKKTKSRNATRRCRSTKTKGKKRH